MNQCKKRSRNATYGTDTLTERIYCELEEVKLMESGEIPSKLEYSKNTNADEYSLTQRICRGLEEIKLMESGQIPSKSAWDLLG